MLKCFGQLIWQFWIHFREGDQEILLSIEVLCELGAKWVHFVMIKIRGSLGGKWAKAVSPGKCEHAQVRDRHRQTHSFIDKQRSGRILLLNATEIHERWMNTGTTQSCLNKIRSLQLHARRSITRKPLKCSVQSLAPGTWAMLAIGFITVILNGEILPSVACKKPCSH